MTTALAVLAIWVAVCVVVAWLAIRLIRNGGSAGYAAITPTAPSDSFIEEAR
jgi:hypothetical protein